MTDLSGEWGMPKFIKKVAKMVPIKVSARGLIEGSIKGLGTVGNVLTGYGIYKRFSTGDSKNGRAMLAGLVVSSVVGLGCGLVVGATVVGVAYCAVVSSVVFAQTRNAVRGFDYE